MDIGRPLRELDVVPQEVPMTPVAPKENVPQPQPAEQEPELVPVR